MAGAEGWLCLVAVGFLQGSGPACDGGVQVWLRVCGGAGFGVSLAAPCERLVAFGRPASLERLMRQHP